MDQQGFKNRRRGDPSEGGEGDGGKEGLRKISGWPARPPLATIRLRQYGPQTLLAWWHKFYLLYIIFFYYHNILFVIFSVQKIEKCL